MFQGPLHGLTAIEVCQSVAGPYVGLILSDLGCRVIKIERPGTGDDSRDWGTMWGGTSATFLALNRGKESVVLDLKSDAGRAAALRLAEKADILVQNYRPGVLDRLGLGYADLTARNPRLIYASISAYGTVGPMRQSPGYDPLIQAFSGMMSITGEPGRPPVRIGASVVDEGAGLWAAMGIILALYERERTGRGRLVETSLLETGIAWLPYQIASYLASGVDPQPLGSAVAIVSPDQSFETQDGHLLVVAGNDHLFAQLCDALGHPEWAADRRFAGNHDRVQNREAMVALMAPVFRSDTTAAWEQRIAAAGVPCSATHRISEAVAHPQTEALGIIEPVPHPRIKDLRLVGLPLRLDGDRPVARRAPPDLGADTERVLRDFGLSERMTAEALGNRAELAPH